MCPSISHEFILWIALAAYALHVLEEQALGWKHWAESCLGLKGLEWATFYVANAAVMFLGIAAAMVGWKFPVFALVIPALQLINGVFFHIAPTIVQRKFSPGVITATLLFLPISVWAYLGAYRDGVLTPQVLIGSLILGALVMASPLIFLRIKGLLKIKN